MRRLSYATVCIVNQKGLRCLINKIEKGREKVVIMLFDRGHCKYESLAKDVKTYSVRSIVSMWRGMYVPVASSQIQAGLR